MKKVYQIEVKLKSDTLIGSGEAFGAVIDTDIVFDDLGIPYIPAKRIKGCLRDSAEEVKDMIERSGLNLLKLGSVDIHNTFGKKGMTFDKREMIASNHVYFHNLTIVDPDEKVKQHYKKNREWLEYLFQEYKELISMDSILDYFTSLRQQTAIDEKGVAKKHSLRTIRVIRKGFTFAGEVLIEAQDSERIFTTLFLACNNLRHIGTKRNRGFGEITCRLVANGEEVFCDIFKEVST